MPSGSLPFSSTHTHSLFHNPNPGDRTPFTFRQVHSLAARFKACLSPFSSASVPISPVLSGFSQPHSFPKHQPLPCHQGPAFSVPKPLATINSGTFSRCLRVPHGTLTPRQGHCCSGIHLPQQAGRSRRTVPGVNTLTTTACLLEPETTVGTQ